MSLRLFFNCVYLRLGSNGPYSTFHVIKIIVCIMQKAHYVKKSATCHVLAVTIVYHLELQTKLERINQLGKNTQLLCVRHTDHCIGGGGVEGDHSGYSEENTDLQVSCSLRILCIGIV